MSYDFAELRLGILELFDEAARMCPRKTAVGELPAMSGRINRPRPRMSSKERRARIREYNKRARQRMNQEWIAGRTARAEQAAQIERAVREAARVSPHVSRPVYVTPCTPCVLCGARGVAHRCPVETKTA